MSALNIYAGEEEIKTGAWKEIQLSFHNFTVVKDLGMKFPTLQSKHKKRYVEVQCNLCKEKYRGQYALFKYRDKVCKCESKKGKGKIRWSNPTRDRILKIRAGMIYRCHNKKCSRYNDYGARGITVCSEWLESPEEFYNWALNNGYKNTLTIERINNEEGYFPENCKWIERRNQSKNRRNCISLDDAIKIKKLLLKKIHHKEIAEKIGCSLNVIQMISCGSSWVDIK